MQGSEDGLEDGEYRPAATISKVSATLSSSPQHSALYVHLFMRARFLLVHHVFFLNEILGKARE